MDQFFAETDKALIPSLPDVSPLKSNDRCRRLMTGFLCKWRGHWLYVRAGFLFNGACVPMIGRGLLGKAFAPEWISGSLMGDAADAGQVFSVTNEPVVFVCLNNHTEIPAEYLKPVWIPPDEADELFRDLTLASTLLLWWKARLALQVIRFWHWLVEKPGLSKEEWNRIQKVRPGHHEGCLRYIENRNTGCGELCEAFFTKG